jgi:hypothetical protein
MGPTSSKIFLAKMFFRQHQMMNGKPNGQTNTKSRSNTKEPNLPIGKSIGKISVKKKTLHHQTLMIQIKTKNLAYLYVTVDSDL